MTNTDEKNFKTAIAKPVLYEGGISRTTLD